MDKNSVIGFILIGCVLFGWTYFQGKRAQEAAALQAQRDSVELVNRLAAEAEAAARDSVLAATTPDSVLAQPSIFKDAVLGESYGVEGGLVSLENDKIAVTFSTKGAKPYSVLVKDYFKYDSTALYVFNPGSAEYSISIYAGESIKTGDFNFQVAERTDTSVVFRLPFTGGAYIEQRYALSAGSYKVDNTISFIGMQGIIPRNVSSFDLDFSMTIPRQEKGYKNESQYSKLDYYFNGEKKPEEIGRGRSASKRIDSRLGWFAFQQQFFSAILCAPNEFASGELFIDFFKENDPDRNLMRCAANMRVDFTQGGNVSVPMEFYFGPNHFQTLKSFDRSYEKIIPLGGWLVGWFTKYAIIPMFNFFHKFIGNFGLIILLMTIVIKIVVFPLSYKSFASSAKMQALKPEIDKINEKYPKQEDAMKKQQATMDLYRRAGASPMGGCLPTLLTFPILWAMFRFFPASIELRQQPFLWCHDLSAYDSILDYGTHIPILGDHLSLFALLMAVTMWFYSKMTTASQASSNDPTASSMKFMTLWMMPIMMFFICNSLSAALSYYYLLSQLIAMLQTWLIRKSIDPEKILEKARQAEGKPQKKSKWQLRLEEAQRIQQQQLKEQQKKARR